jgi:hypothetical protein
VSLIGWNITNPMEKHHFLGNFKPTYLPPQNLPFMGFRSAAAGKI